jgi:hypothetical protein
MNTQLNSAPPEDDAMDALLVRVHPKILSRIRMDGRPTRARRSRLVVGCAALVLAAGGAAAAAVAASTVTSEPMSSAEHSKRLGQPSGVLPDGRTFGAIPVPPGNQLDRATMPDLLPATGDHGKDGLVDAKVLTSWEPKGSCESTQIPVYALDGTTQIDTLTIGRATELVKGLRLVERSGDPCK